MKIRCRFRCRLLHYVAANPHLASELRPVDDEGGPRVLGQLAPLLALVIGKETEAALVEAA